MNMQTDNSQNQLQQQKKNRFVFIRDLYERNPNTFIFTCLALILVFLLITVGFWKTLLILVFVGAAYVYGQYKDQKAWVYYFLKNLFR